MKKTITLLFLMPLLCAIGCKNNETYEAPPMPSLYRDAADSLEHVKRQAEEDNKPMMSEPSDNERMSVSENDPYEIMHVAFVGEPEISEIKPMLEKVMTRYGYEKTDDNRLKIGNMLVVLRKDSKVGVTEMSILKDIYLNGSDLIKLGEQAAISATLLESK